MSRLTRRGFLGAGAAGLLAASASARSQQVAAPYQGFRRVTLIGEDDRPLRPDALTAEQEYLFFYPYRATPCFLLDLGRPAPPAELQTAAGERYRWPGGVGPRRSVVAFAAICAHKLSYPAKPVSFIGYRSRPVGYLGPDNGIERRPAVIQCCSEHSIYDPFQGARVLSGPAPQPLAAVALEQDLGHGGLIATGVFGGLVYERFFERFGYKLAIEYNDRARELVSGGVSVVPTERYCRQRIQC